MADKKFVSYLRVSTTRQGISGLGLEAQRRSVKEYLGAMTSLQIGEFVEVESGRNTERSELTRALSMCRVHGAVLVVAKLDRLSRDAHFLLGLKESGVEFVCCDMPSANRLTVGIMAMVAEEEARLISVRTKAALAVAKERGVKLGTPNLTPERRALGTAASARVRSAKAKRRAQDLLPILNELKGEGHRRPTEIARALNERGVPASRGGAWSIGQVQRLLAIA